MSGRSVRSVDTAAQAAGQQKQPAVPHVSARDVLSNFTTFSCRVPMSNTGTEGYRYLIRRLYQPRSGMLERTSPSSTSLRITWGSSGLASVAGVGPGTCSGCAGSPRENHRDRCERHHLGPGISGIREPARSGNAATNRHAIRDRRSQETGWCGVPIRIRPRQWTLGTPN